MRDKLIELLEEADAKVGEWIRENDHMDFVPTRAELHGVEADCLLASGVIVPRIKVGDHIYYKQRGKTISAKVFYLNVTLMEDYVRISEANAISEDGFTVEFDEDSIGKTVFLSREEAEQVMKEKHEKRSI